MKKRKKVTLNGSAHQDDKCSLCYRCGQFDPSALRLRAVTASILDRRTDCHIEYAPIRPPFLQESDTLHTTTSYRFGDITHHCYSVCRKCDNINTSEVRMHTAKIEPIQERAAKLHLFSIIPLLIAVLLALRFFFGWFPGFTLLSQLIFIGSVVLVLVMNIWAENIEESLPPLDNDHWPTGPVGFRKYHRDKCLEAHKQLHNTAMVAICHYADYRTWEKYRFSELFCPFIQHRSGNLLLTGRETCNSEPKYDCRECQVKV